MMRSTPSNTSRIGSGGILRDLISLRLSDLIPPTAARAASRTGCTSANSFSTCFLRSAILTCTYGGNVGCEMWGMWGVRCGVT